MALVIQILADAQAALQGNHIFGKSGQSCIVVLIVLQIKILSAAIQYAESLLPVLYTYVYVNGIGKGMKDNRHSHVCTLLHLCVHIASA